MRALLFAQLKGCAGPGKDSVLCRKRRGAGKRVASRRGLGERRRDIGVAEILAVEQQGLADRTRQGIGKAIAEIEPRRMAAAAAVIAIGLDALDPLASASVTATVMLSPVSAANSRASRWASSFLMFRLIFLPFSAKILATPGRLANRAGKGRIRGRPEGAGGMRPMTSYLETYRRSLEKPEEFWAEAAEAIDWGHV